MTLSRFRDLYIALACLLLAPLVLAASRPNIVIILSDDMGFSDIGCYGGEIHTPNLDRLAAGGIRFTQFYNTGRCCPTRASLLTGLYPHQAGVGHMMSDRGYDGYRGDLNRNCITIAEALRPAGYSTYMAGKWHVTKSTRPEGPKYNWPLQRGFDRFYGTITGAGSYFDPSTLTRDNEMISPDADPEYRPEKYYYTVAISDHAVRFIREHVERNAAKPFFLYVAYTAAHWPMHALERDIQKYRGKYDAGYEKVRRTRFRRLKELGLIDPEWTLSPRAEDWEKVKSPGWEARCMEVYAAMIDAMDQGIGRIVAQLERDHQLGNTLLFFLQDNGGCAEGVGRTARGEYTSRPERPPFPAMPKGTLQRDMIPKQTRDGYPTIQGRGAMPGPDGTFIAYGRGWANVSNTPFREYKHWVHEGGIATPLIAHWPEGIPRRGELEKQSAHLIDLMATCVDVAGASYPERFDGEPIKPLEGRSLVPAFRGETIQREALYWEHEGNRAVRVGRWKLVAKGARGKWELYDMEVDRTEMHDLAGEQPDRVAKLAAMWQAYAERANVLPLNPSATGKGGGGSSFSKRTRFELVKGARLPREKAPFVAGRGFQLNARFEADGRDGVIVAQGGSADGYALYVKNGRLSFAMRHEGTSTVLESAGVLEPGTVRVELSLTREGEVTLAASSASGTESVHRRGPGPLKKMPIDGLQVGRDARGAVGPYEAPFPFEGTIDAVTIRLDGGQE